MSERLKRFEQMAAAAAREPAPEIDVALPTLRRIERRAEPAPLRPLAGLAAVSAVPAAVALVWVLVFFGAVADPLGSMFQIAAAVAP